MKHRDHHTAARQPTRTELENRIRQLEVIVENRETQLKWRHERINELQARLDEIQKIAGRK